MVDEIEQMYYYSDEDTRVKGGAIMEEHKKRNEEIREGLLREDLSRTESDKMRSFIATVAWSIQDEKLLRMLYIRAKTIKRQ